MVLKEILGAVNYGRIPCLRNFGTENLRNFTHRLDGKSRLARVFQIVGNRVIEMAAVKKIEAFVRFLRSHCGICGIAVMVNADFQPGIHGTAVVTFKLGISLRIPYAGVSVAAVTVADHGKFNTGIFHRSPVDRRLNIRHIDSLNRCDRTVRFCGKSKRSSAHQHHKKQCSHFLRSDFFQLTLTPFQIPFHLRKKAFDCGICLPVLSKCRETAVEKYILLGLLYFRKLPLSRYS